MQKKKKENTKLYNLVCVCLVFTRCKLVPLSHFGCMTTGTRIIVGSCIQMYLGFLRTSFWLWALCDAVASLLLQWALCHSMDTCPRSTDHHHHYLDMTYTVILPPLSVHIWFIDWMVPSIHVLHLRILLQADFEKFVKQVLKDFEKQVTVVNLDCCTRDVLEQLLMCCWHGGLAATANDV